MPDFLKRRRDIEVWTTLPGIFYAGWSVKPRALIGCERSGRVRRAMRLRGVDAWSVDLLPPEDGDVHHLQCDVRDVMDDGWDLGIFFPDCTYLTCSAEWAYGDGPYHQRVKPETLVGAARRRARLDAADFALRLWRSSSIARLGLENPRGYLSLVIGKPTQTIQPHQFGEDASKATCLWLRGLPPLVPTKHVPPRWVCCGIELPDGVGAFGCANCNGERRALPRWSNQTNSGQNRIGPRAGRASDRSRTFQGIADAMAAQWSPLILQKEVA